MAREVDLLIVGAGPAGCTAARVAAGQGLRVLVVERRPTVGLPVQCAEYVPAQIVAHVPIPETCIAQRIRALRTYLPTGEVVETPAPGYVLHRVLFDKALAVAACRAGAEIWTAARAVERTPRGVLVRRGAGLEEIVPRILIGADGPLSTVGRWIGQTNAELIDTLQVEAVLPPSLAEDGGHECTHVYFDPVYRGGYGWLFPKGETANVGVGVNRRMGGDPSRALAHLLDRLRIRPGDILGHTGGPVPSGGPVARTQVGEVLLVGDAAGHTHPITGAGIFAAIVGGTLAGQAAVRAVQTGDLSALEEYEREWTAFLGGPLRHALKKRRYLDAHWSDDPVALSAALRRTWIAFREYSRPEGESETTKSTKVTQEI
ncbi:MAG: NAD(P)/FAD-dependent oxidoreductase [Anaerolineae bacterium]|nr:NAD(P)/FAD-dependent oxidoreductase [Anaerolineae bacterium]MDW7990754.1 NAD(P)/FAD-dependent oxidoreductase [Anaerolineae bacterium]